MIVYPVPIRDLHWENTRDGLVHQVREVYPGELADCSPLRFVKTRTGEARMVCGICLRNDRYQSTSKVVSCINCLTDTNLGLRTIDGRPVKGIGVE